MDIKAGDVWAETNTGAYGACYEVARKKQMTCFANDIGSYSNAIGHALLKNEKSEIASLGAAHMDENFNVTDDYDENVRGKWMAWFERHSLRQRHHIISRMTWQDFIPALADQNVDVLYADFAWPWRGGDVTDEYVQSAFKMDKILEYNSMDVKIPSAKEIWNDVDQFITEGLKVARFVVLSNQSSNYPNMDALREYVEGRYPLRLERRLDVPASKVDNQGKWPWFMEQQIVIAY